MRRPWWNPLDLLFAHVVGSYAALGGLAALTAVSSGRFVNVACLACGAPISLPLLACMAGTRDGRAILSPIQAVFLAAAYPTVFGITVTCVRYRYYRALVASNACRTCGYNLTGNESGICPECGTPVSAPARGGRGAAWEFPPDRPADVRGDHLDDVHD